MNEILRPSQISFQEVLQLVELIKSSASFSELRIRSGDLEIDLRRGSVGVVPVEAPVLNGTAQTTLETTLPAAGNSPAPSSPNRRSAAALSPEASVVTAPMVGTVYRAAEPGAAPFVEIGRKVEPGDQLCIVEVMKLMNAVHAESRGTVTEILFGDGDAVEFGQELFVISAR